MNALRLFQTHPVTGDKGDFALSGENDRKRWRPHYCEPSPTQMAQNRLWVDDYESGRHSLANHSSRTAWSLGSRAKYNRHPTARVRVGHLAEDCELLSVALNPQLHFCAVRKWSRGNYKTPEQTRIAGVSIKPSSRFYIGRFDRRRERLTDRATAFGQHWPSSAGEGMLRFQNAIKRGMPRQREKKQSLSRRHLPKNRALPKNVGIREPLSRVNGLPKKDV